MNPYWPAITRNTGIYLAVAEMADLAGNRAILELIIDDVDYNHHMMNLFLQNIFNDIDPELLHRIVRKLLLLDPSKESDVGYYAIHDICRKRNLLPQTIKLILDNIGDEEEYKHIIELLLASNPAMTPELLKEMSIKYSIYPDIINKICLNPSANEPLISEILDKATRDRDLVKMGFALQSGKLPIEKILNVIGDNPEFSLLYCECQEKMLEDMPEAEHLVFELEQLIDNILAGHPDTPVIELERLTLLGGVPVARIHHLQNLIAGNPSIPHDAAQYLSTVNSGGILRSLLENSSVCLEVKAPLLRHDNAHVRDIAVENIEDIELLNINFLQEEDEDVIDTYLMNPNIDIAPYLRRDKQNSLVLYIRDDLPGELLRDVVEENSPLLPAILSNYSIPEDILWARIRQEVSDTTWREHAYLAVNPSLTKDMISELATSKDLLTRFLLTLRKDLDRDTAVILALTSQNFVEVE